MKNSPKRCGGGEIDQISLVKLKELGILVVTGSGGQTKYNRTRLKLPKSHWIDAACVGVLESLELKTKQPLLIKSCGYGSRLMTRVNAYGFPCTKAKQKPFGDWKTGDLVKLITKKGAVFTHRLLATSNPSGFELRINGKRIKANPKTNTLIKIQARDGYCYSY